MQKMLLKHAMGMIMMGTVCVLNSHAVVAVQAISVLAATVIEAVAIAVLNFFLLFFLIFLDFISCLCLFIFKLLGAVTKRSQYRVLVSGLPPSGSWQDLKDHMREAGDVCFADTYKDGTGVVEFLRHDDMKYAIKKLDDSRFRSHEVRLKSELYQIYKSH